MSFFNLNQHFDYQHEGSLFFWFSFQTGICPTELQDCLTVHTWRKGVVGVGLHEGVIGGAVSPRTAAAGQQLQHLCPL